MTFKVLTLKNPEKNLQFVNTSLLHKGIYSTTIPTLYAVTETMETLEKKFRDFGMRIEFDMITALHNLERCQLTEVELKLK